MFEDIVTSQPTPQVIPKEIIRKKTPRPPKIITAFEVVRDCNDPRMLAKILDLCKSKIRKQKRKARAARKVRRKERQ